MEKIIHVEVRVIPREVKQGAEKGKKFMAYQIFNKQKGYYEEVRFNSKVKNMPTEKGSFIIDVDVTEINRQGNENRKYPLTWISKIIAVKPLEKVLHTETPDQELPF